MPPTIFWSWQSDVFPKACRQLIKSCLQQAIKDLHEELALSDAERPELDHDTKGESGMVDIAETILRKIADSAIFVADLTPIAKSASGKPLPNPNVLVELGWAFSRPGLTRVIGVFNRASGEKIENLPFDIRQRRVLSYALSEDAPAAEFQNVQKALTKDLAGALRINLASHLNNQAQAITVEGVPVHPDDPSIWSTSSDRFNHHESFGGSTVESIKLSPPPRAYIRVIPAGWKDTPPRVSDIAKLPEKMIVWPPTKLSNGSFGNTDEGFVRYWFTGADADRYAPDVAMYFDETGEFWVLQGTAVAKSGEHPRLRVAHLLNGWRNVLHESMKVFDHFGAAPTRKVEVGLVGMKTVHWPGNWLSDAPLGRKSHFAFPRQDRNWDDEAQKRFLIDAYDSVRNLFGLDRADPDEAAKLIS